MQRFSNSTHVDPILIMHAHERGVFEAVILGDNQTTHDETAPEFINSTEISKPRTPCPLTLALPVMYLEMMGWRK